MKDYHHDHRHAVHLRPDYIMKLAYVTAIQAAYSHFVIQREVRLIAVCSQCHVTVAMVMISKTPPRPMYMREWTHLGNSKHSPTGKV